MRKGFTMLNFKTNLNPVYADPAKQAKLEEAIARGFIRRSRDPDGLLRYTITAAGLRQWAWEKFSGE